MFLVGGPVRDALLGLAVADLDFSVEGDAIALARKLARRLGGKVTAHSRFGTATVSFQHPVSGSPDFSRRTPATGGGLVRIDLVSARRESYPMPGRLPVVERGDIADDLARRDFSINAMALPLAPPSFPPLRGGMDKGVAPIKGGMDKGVLDTHGGGMSEGVVPLRGGMGKGALDPLGGLEDLEAGVVRVLHRLSFVDDPTRMMRAVRYEQRLGFEIAPDTLSLMADALANKGMDTVSGDRWRHELEKILGEKAPVAPLRRAAELGLLAGLHPAFEKLADGEYAVFRRLDDIRRESGHVTGGMCLAALFAPLSAPETEGVIQRLRLTGQRAAIARDTIVLRDSEEGIGRLVQRGADRPSGLARHLSGLDAEAVAAWAELTGDAEVAGVLRRYARELREVKQAVKGGDLLAMGAVKGPMVGDLLETLRDARLDGLVSSDEEERAMARELVARKLAGDTE